MDECTDRRTSGRTDKPLYRDVRMHRNMDQGPNQYTSYGGCHQMEKSCKRCTFHQAFVFRHCNSFYLLIK